jgi:glycine/D-amino acid oxidase-like deaminating enzyme
VAERFPLLANAPIAETRRCHYESSLNRDFIIDWHPQYSNVLLAGAGNAEGAKFAILIGDYVAQRLLRIEGDAEIDRRFRIPEDTYTSAAAKAEARALARADSVARADSMARADSLAKARGRE